MFTPVSIFTDQWLIGPTNQLQTPYGDYHYFSLYVFKATLLSFPLFVKKMKLF